MKGLVLDRPHPTLTTSGVEVCLEIVRPQIGKLVIKLQNPALATTVLDADTLDRHLEGHALDLEFLTVFADTRDVSGIDGEAHHSALIPKPKGVEEFFT